MVPLVIMARKRDVDIGLRRITLQDFTVWTNRVANAPLKIRHGQSCVRKVEDFVPFPSVAVPPCGHPYKGCEIVIDKHRYELVQV